MYALIYNIYHYQYGLILFLKNILQKFGINEKIF